MTKISFLGDIMCDNEMSKRYLENGVMTSLQNHTESFSHLRTLLYDSDYVIGNLETPVSFSETDLTFKQWEFNSPKEFANAVKEAGVDFVSTANNHCMDRGVSGLISTERSLQSIGLVQCGINTNDNQRYRIIDVNGIKFGILAYTYGTNAFSNNQYLKFKERKFVNLLQEQEEYIYKVWLKIFHNHLRRVFYFLDDHLFPENRNKYNYEKETVSFYRYSLIQSDIREVKKNKVDCIISLLHIGGQYNKEPSAYTKRTVDWFLNHGCNLVICNHEHVIHGTKAENRSFAAYALGNCIGSAGVCREPYNRRSEYSIALHVYFDDASKSISKITFSVLKTILNDKGNFEVWPVFDLIKNSYETEINSLLTESLKAAKDFSGISYNSIEREFQYISY